MILQMLINIMFVRYVSDNNFTYFNVMSLKLFVYTSLRNQ